MVHFYFHEMFFKEMLVLISFVTNANEYKLDEKNKFFAVSLFGGMPSLSADFYCSEGRISRHSFLIECQTEPRGKGVKKLGNSW